MHVVADPATYVFNKKARDHGYVDAMAIVRVSFYARERSGISEPISNWVGKKKRAD